MMGTEATNGVMMRPGVHRAEEIGDCFALFVVDALKHGRQTAWDWQPPRDASQMYVRNSIPLEELEAMSRFPKWAAPSP